MSPVITGALRPDQYLDPAQTSHRIESANASDSSASQNPATASPKINLAAIIGNALLRVLAIGAGVAILAASASAVIVAGKLTGPDAALVAALSLGVAVGAVVIPHVRAGLAVVIVLALLAGEAFNLLSTAERVISAREATASATLDTNSKRTEAAQRLSAALAAQVDQSNAALRTVATPDCRKECRALIETQADKLAAEVTAARAALAAAPATKSATPLADRLGVPAWGLDLLSAALLSIGANGLAAALIAAGSHAGRTQRTASPSPTFPARRAPASINPETLAVELQGHAALAAMADPHGTSHVMHIPTPSGADLPNTPERQHARRSKQAPTSPAVVETQGKIIDLVRGNDGKLQTSVRGLKALIGDASLSTVHTALASLVAAGVIERAGDALILARSAA